MTVSISFHIGIDETCIEISAPPPEMRWSSVSTWGAVRAIVNSVADFVESMGASALAYTDLAICFDQGVEMPQMPNGKEIPRRWVIASRFAGNIAKNIREGWIVIHEDCLVLGEESVPDSASYERFSNDKVALAKSQP